MNGVSVNWGVEMRKSLHATGETPQGAVMVLADKSELVTEEELLSLIYNNLESLA